MLKKNDIKRMLDIKVRVIISIIFSIFNFIIQRDEVRRIYEVDDGYLGHYRFYRICSIIVSTVIIYIVFNIFYNLFFSDEAKLKLKSKFWLIYFLINAIILLLVWPGIFKGDEFYVIPFVMRGRIEWAQSLYTCLFYHTALMSLPYLVGITLLQIIIICCLASEVFIVIYDYVANKKIVWIILIPFCLFPVLDNNQFTLRASIISWLFTYFLIFNYVSIKKSDITLKTFIKNALLLAIMANWKMEYAILIVIYLFVIILAACLHKICLKHLIIGIMSLTILHIAIGMPAKMYDDTDNYLMTSIFTPFAEVLRNNIDDIRENDELQHALNEIDEVTSVDDIVKSSIRINLPETFWNLEGTSKEVQVRWVKAAAKICAYYWKDYVNNRWYVYRYTNGMIPNVLNHTGSEDPEIVLNMEYQGSNYFREHFKMTDPILGDSIRRTVISILNCRYPSDYYHTNCLYPIMYNSLIPFILLVGLLIRNLKNKNICDVLLLCSTIAIAIINFILVPATFWMYYMPFYLAAYVFIFFKLVLRFDRTK